MTKQLPESERRILELHTVRARDLALRLFAANSAVFPDGWMKSFVEPIVIELFEFVFHARRIEELTGITIKERSEMSLSRYDLLKNAPTDVCTCYSVALDLVMHAKTYVLGTPVVAHADYPNGDYRFVGYVQVQTDKGKTGSIFLYGLVTTFVNHVLPTLKDRYPQVRF